MSEKHNPAPAEQQPVAWARMKHGKIISVSHDKGVAEFLAGFAASELVPLYLQPQPEPSAQVEPVAYLRKDQLDHVKRMGAMFGEIAASPRVDRVPVYAAPQPAEQQPAPDVAGLVEVLEFASKTLSTACLRGEVTRRIDAALAAYRNQGGKP